jgi:hypothetical protein
MRPGRGNSDHPVAADAAATAVVVVVADMVADAAKAASEEATRNPHAVRDYFCSLGKTCPW